MNEIQVDLCVIGAGSGGLSMAAVVSQLGLKVALVESNKMGGDCLNTGCVPSKALLSAAKHTDVKKIIGRYGITNASVESDYAKVQQYVQDVIATIAPHDSVERFTGLGVNVIQAKAEFNSPNSVIAGDNLIRAKHFVIATGSSAAIVPIPGIDGVPYLTNETIFDLKERPEHLIIIGGGPIGCELAQAYLRLGSKVSVCELFNIMPKDDPELVDVVRRSLIADGLNLYENIQVESIEKTESGIVVNVSKDGQKQQLMGSHLLVAAGRKANVSDLGLEKAGVEYDRRGIKVSSRLKTSNKKIYAIGDVIGSFQFTHAAGYHAGIVIRNLLFHLPAKVNYKAMPWVTYTSPELAHVGLTEAMAKQQKLDYKTVSVNFSHIDRAVAEDETEGCIKVIVTKKGNILGASIVGADAGELIIPWVLAIQNNLKLSKMAALIVPYPTRNDISRQVASEFYKPSLYSNKTKKIVKFLSKF